MEAFPVLNIYRVNATHFKGFMSMAYLLHPELV